MKRWFNADFKTQDDMNAFQSWLAAWERENKEDTEAKVRFCRVHDLFAVMTIVSSDEHFDVLFNSVGGFNGYAHE